MNIKFFKDIKENDIAGGKGASLVKMYQNKFNIPNGYIITADVFSEFLIQNNVKEKIQTIIAKSNINDEKEIERNSKEIVQIISKCSISDEVKNQIIGNYKELNCKYVAVRSSATSEDGKSQAWAGQLETFLNVNETTIIESVKKCWTSVFSPRALFYRIKNNDKSDVAVAVVVQQMIQSEISGVAFSINPTNNNLNEIVIESVLGLGEAIVSGKVTPDTYIVNKKENKIKSKEIKTQKNKLVQIDGTNNWIKIQDKNLQKLSDKMILRLSDLIKKIEKFYGFPVDVEWGIVNGEIYILQCRPITTLKVNKINDMINTINRIGEWKYYVTRNFNWFLENTQIYGSGAEAQNKLLGFNVATKNYLILNGDEYSLESDFKEIYEILETNFAKDLEFFEKFADKEFKLVKKIKKYIHDLKQKDLNHMSFAELYKEMKQFNQEYVDSFVPAFTRPESFLEIALRKELERMNLGENEIEDIFTKVSTCPNYGKLSYSEEPLDLLNIALEMKKGNDIEGLLDRHIEKYAWIKAPVAFEDTCFTREDYMNRLEHLKEADIESKIENILQMRAMNDTNYEAVLKQYQFSEKVLKLIKAIRDFIFLRTHTTEYSDYLFYVARHTIFQVVSQKCNISVDDLIMLSCEEILNILKNNGDLDEEFRNVIKERKKGFAIIWLDGKVQTFLGDESLELQTEIGKTYKTNENQEKEKNVICGTIANKGKIRGVARILLTYNDIYKVKKGDIIVATMTTPDYISAMEKASGFVTDEGGITCHAAIISREFNVPCIVGTVNGTKELKDGQMIELDAYNGKVYILD